MMQILYKRFLTFTCDTGDTINIEGNKWTCVVPCQVVGATIIEGQPVLQGPKKNTDELVLASSLRTPGKPGQVKIEVMTLGAYQRIDSIDLIGKTITDVRDTCSSLIIMCQDKTYVKQVVHSDCEDTYLRSNDLTMVDLNDMGLLSDDTWDEYEAQKAAVKVDAGVIHGQGQLKAAIRNLGIKRVKEIVGSQ